MSAGVARAAPALLGAEQSGAAALPTLRKADGCVGTVPHFGRTGRDYTAPNGTIQMKSDSGWRWVQIAFKSMTNIPDIATTHVTQPPKHGRVIIGTVDEKRRFAYNPEAGFQGTDIFSVSAATINNTYDIPVTVIVGP